MEFANKTVLITGSNRGLGRALATAFAAEGARLVLHARKPSESFDALCESLRNDCGVEVLPIYFDMCEVKRMDSCIRELAMKHVDIDVLVNSAGIAHASIFALTPMAKMREVFEVNFFGAVELTQRVLKLMMRHKNGVIVNIGSVTGLIMSEGQTAYSASKAALMNFSRNLAAEVGRFGIRVNAVAPGLLNTDMRNELNARELEFWEKHTVLGRLGEARDVVEVVKFLASDRGSFVNGQTIRVDGGLL